MLNWFSLLLNAILPPRCLSCGKVIFSEDSLCAECFRNINFITEPVCQHCGTPLPDSVSRGILCPSCLTVRDPFRFCRSAVLYDDFSKKLILDFKFSDHLENKILLSRWLYQAGKDIFANGTDLIIPVPLHYTRLIKRKYNQSAILADELSKLSSIPVDYKTLKKLKHTRPQVSCNGKERMINIRHAFEVTKNEDIKNKRVVLIDDVYTTGSTLKECAKVLKRAGAKSVDALTVARVYSK